jgi:hypothetical protein
MKIKKTVKKLLKLSLNNKAILIAIVMMVSSAAISYFYVLQNEPLIDSLKVDMQNKQSYIRDIWTNSAQVENKADIAILISLMTKNETKESKQLIDHFLSAIPNLKDKSDLFEILRAIELEKKISIENINNLYIQKEKIENKIFSLEKKNKLYSDIAFFLQMLSLVIIIIKDDIPL